MTIFQGNVVIKSKRVSAKIASSERSADTSWQQDGSGSTGVQECANSEGVVGSKFEEADLT